MKFFETQHIAQIDAYTIQHEPISSTELMERVASALVFEIISRWTRTTRVVVFAGPGNNGGDALAVARLLLDEGYKVEIFLFNAENRLSADCQHNKDLLFERKYRHFIEVANSFTPPPLFTNTLVIDGLFGSGLRNSLTGGFSSLAQYINLSGAQVVSIDIPSGLFGEDNTNNEYRSIVQATLTLSLQFPKLAFFLKENEFCVGEWKLIDIGLHPDVIADTETSYYYTLAEDVRLLLKKKSRFASKRDFGHVMIVAGSYGMVGAAVLCCKGALHSGVGLVTLQAPLCANLIIQTALPEVIFKSANHEKHLDSIEEIRHHTALVFGPGIGTHADTAQLLSHLIDTVRIPLLIDADGLNLLAQNTILLPLLPANTILTPHEGEFDRLFGRCYTGYDRVKKAQEMAQKYNIIVILKGAYTVVALPSGALHFNSTGNVGMATAGCGDLLAGIIGGLLAQGYLPEEAAITGVFLHGLAGDMAAANLSAPYITASDIAQYISKAYLNLSDVSV